MAGQIIEAFTELAPRYERTMDRELRFMWGLSYPDFVNLLVGAAALEGDGWVLDLATGTANIPLGIVAAPEVVARVVGLDITPAMLSEGSRKVRQAPNGEQIRLVCGSAMNIGLADAAVEAVFCGLAMHHLNVPRTLSEIARVLAVGGHFVLGVVGVPQFWRSWWGKRVVESGIRTFYLLTHGGPRAQAEAEALYNLHTIAEWQAILPEYGFEIVDITEITSRFKWGPNALVVKAKLASRPQ